MKVFLIMLIVLLCGCAREQDQFECLWRGGFATCDKGDDGGKNGSAGEASEEQGEQEGQTVTCSQNNINNLASGDSLTGTYGEDDVTVTCASGYKSNAASITCQSNGEFDVPVRCSAEEWLIQLHGNDQFANPAGGNFDFTKSEYTNTFTADNLGNIYAVGSRNNTATGTGFDAYFLKINGDGEVVKAIAFDGSTPQAHLGNVGQNDFLRGATIDSDNNIYVTVETVGNFATNADNSSPGVDQDCAVVKFNSDGEIQWATQIDDSNGAVSDSTGNDYCGAIAVHGSGSSAVIYVGGNTTGTLDGADLGGSKDGFVAKLNSSGAIQWVKQVSETANPDTANTECYSLDVDSSGNVYCGGYTNGGDAMVVKFNSSGVEGTKYKIATGEGPYAKINDIKIDSSGNIYGVGKTDEAIGDDGDVDDPNGDGFFIKLDSSLTKVWIKQLGSAGAPAGSNVLGTESCRKIDLDANEDVIGLCMTDRPFLSGGNNLNTVKQPLLMKLSAAGSISWANQYDDTYGATVATDYVEDSSGGNIMQDYEGYLGSGLVINPDGSIYIGSVIEQANYGYAKNFNVSGSAKTSGADSDPWIMKLQETVGDLKAN